MQENESIYYYDTKEIKKKLIVRESCLTPFNLYNTNLKYNYH